MTDKTTDNPALARRQLGFLETFDRKYDGFFRELERLERIVAAGGVPPVRGWPTEGLERISRSLVGAGAVYGLPTVTTWARGLLERLNRIRNSPVAPDRENFAWLEEQVAALMEIEAGLTRTARRIIDPATAPEPDETNEEVPRVVTPVPPRPSSDATAPVPSHPPPPPAPERPNMEPGSGTDSPAPGALPDGLPMEERDERLVSRAWQVLALVALLALGFSLWFDYRLFASFSRDDHRGAVTATDVGRALAEPPAPPSPARPAVEHAPEPTPAPEPASAPQPTPEPQAEVEAEVEAQASGGYRRGPRGDEVDSTDDDEEEQRRKERRARRKKRDAEAAESSSAGGAPGNPYVD